MTAANKGNSFEGVRIRISNSGVRSVVSEIMQYRTQVTRTDEIKSVGGWADALNHLLASYLQSVRDTLAICTDDPILRAASTRDQTTSSAGQGQVQADRETAAADETLLLRDIFPASSPISTDDIQMPATSMMALPYDFSGAHPNVPQMSDPKYQNAFLIQFVTVLDMMVRDATNLACATYGNTIPKDQSAILHSRLEEAYAILEHKGGRLNMPKIPNGTDPESLTGKVSAAVLPVQITDPSGEVAEPNGTAASA